MDERRSEPRFMCADLVQVRIEDAAGVRELTANLEDISASGACIQLEVGAQTGAEVELMCKKCRFRGRVSYCRFGALGYDVGVAFNQKRSWNEKRFAPRHLLKMPMGSWARPTSFASKYWT
jgi:hypothetical protein